MEKILFINACVRPQSRTMRLARRLLSHLEGEVTEVDLQREAITPHTNERLERRNACLAAGDHTEPMFRYALQFREADTIVIAAPYYDLSFPASLKNYLEIVANVGLTFYYDENEQSRTLCRAKRFFYVTTAGADFVPDFGYLYIRAMFREFYGVEEGYCFCADRLDLRNSDPEQLLAQAIREIDEFFDCFEA